MKRVAAAVAAITLTAALALTSGVVAAVADSTQSPTVATLPTPWVEVLSQRCETLDATHFRFADGALLVRRVGSGVTYEALNAAGEDVSAHSILLPPGRYVVTFTAPAGSVFDSGSAIVTDDRSILSAKPCGKPATRVVRGKWHVEVTAHRVKVWRTIKTTRWHADLDWDGMGGRWVGVTSKSRETVTVRR